MGLVELAVEKVKESLVRETVVESGPGLDWRLGAGVDMDDSLFIHWV